MSEIFIGMPGNILNILGNFLHSCSQLYSYGIPEYLCIATQKYFRDFTESFGYKKDTLEYLTHIASSANRSNNLFKYKDNGSTTFFKQDCR